MISDKPLVFEAVKPGTGIEEMVATRQPGWEEETMSSQEETIRNMVDDYLRQTNEHFHISLSRGPAAVEWMAGWIPRLGNFDETTKEGIALSMGALLGESIITAYGGQWHISGSNWEVHLPSGKIVLPIETVKNQMRGGQSISLIFQKLGKKPWWKIW